MNSPTPLAANRTSLTMANGLMIDLLNPQVIDVDFWVISEHLAKANRYCGATRDLTYSVAEHSVRCANAAYEQYGEKAAAYLLCHDMHEAFLGDDVTPKKKALASIMESFGVLAGEIEKAFAALTDRIDTVIHNAAGLDWPPPDEMKAAIHYIDRVLLATEWRDLMRCAVPFDFGVSTLLGPPINPMPWRPAREALIAKCKKLLPALQARAA